MLKNNKGITLIALVITIIVLLILAGVSIAMLTGGNGLLTKATEAKVQNYRGEVADRINTALNACYAEILSNQYGVGENILKENKGSDILTQNGLDELNKDTENRIGEYKATTKDQEGICVSIWWAPDSKHADYGDGMEGTITKKEATSGKKGEIPYTVQPATVNMPAKATPSITEGA